MLTIPGQHDLVSHNDLLDTPMMTMASAQVVTILNGEFPLEDITNNGMMVHIYGHSFGTPVPEPRETDAFRILVTHQMVSDRDYWNGTVRFTQAKRFMRTLQNRYDLIICGDNHNHFVLHNDNMQLFNCGSLMRATIAQRDHKPVAYVYDVDTREYTLVEVPIQPSNEVFSPDSDPVVLARRSGVDMAPFVEQLRAGRHGVSSMSYVETLWRVAEARRINDRVRTMIEEDLRNAYNETERPVSRS
jgi:DNA repair exonuclease SbcCD nuclease subunit